MADKRAGLYLHIPFCDGKCGYCDFYSVAADTDVMQKYCGALVSEIKGAARLFCNYTIDTIYIGGGTPSLLPIGTLARILDAISDFSLDLKEVTVEANPADHLDPKSYARLGIDRISLGVQSLSDPVLKAIGRRHDARTAIAALERCAEHLPRVSADLIVGLPGTTPAEDVASVQGVLPYVGHVSQYLLKLDPASPMAKAVAAGKTVLPDDDAAVDAYERVAEELRQNGFARYEISNFAREGEQSLHNLKYWKRLPYIGLGAAAHSFIGDTRYENPADLTRYCSGVSVGHGNVRGQTIGKEEAVFETVMLGLRLSEGFSIEEVNRAFDIDFLRDYAEELREVGFMLRSDNGRLRLKEEWFLLESAVARAFLR